MKIRNCFVSNSSTCSFIFLGYELDNFENDDPYEHFKKMGLDYENLEYGPQLVGKILLWISDGFEESENLEIPFEKLEEFKEEIKKKLNREDNPKFYTGITVC